jgi:zinc transporter 2
VPFAALCVQIMAVSEATLDTSKGYPPSLWVHMVRDVHMAEGVAGTLSALQKAGFPAAEVRVHPQPLLAGTLAARISGVDNATSARAHAALATAGLLDEEGLLKQDPRRSDWREVLTAAGGVGGDSFQPDASAVAETLNVLWAVHELTRDALPETMAFFRAALDDATASH